MTASTAIQDFLPDNHCFGCGPANEQGLQIKSYWQASSATATCAFVGQPHHNAGAPHVLNGGIIATVIDCHCICTAVAAAYSAANLALGVDPLIWYVTGGLQLDYRAPAPLGEPVRLTARVMDATDRRSTVTCELMAGDTLCVTASLVAVRVPSAWREPG
jgi:acyl-coenzyme A thioesterase PaaI-like protein